MAIDTDRTPERPETQPEPEKKTDMHKVIEAIGTKLIDSKVTDPGQREQLRSAIDNRLAERSLQGRVPVVQVYDKNVQAPQQDRTGPVVERNSERTR